LSALAAALAQAGRFAEARETAEAIEDDGQRTEALRDMALALAQAGQVEEAESAFARRGRRRRRLRGRVPGVGVE